MSSLEYMLARHTAHSQNRERGVVMMRIAAVTVALGLAVMIITLAVFTGFRREITADFRGFAADIEVIDLLSLGRSQKSPIKKDDAMKSWIESLPEVQSVGEYATAGVMIKSEDKVVGVQLKGVEADYDTSWWEQSILQGELPDLKAEYRTKQLLLSQATANSLEVGVGDKLELLYIDESSSARRDSYRVAGIYSTGMEEMDRVTVLSDVRDVRRLAGWDEQMIMGYDVMLHDAESSEQVAKLIDDHILQLSDNSGMINTLAATMQMRYPVVFDWMTAHTMIAQAVIIIMMAVLLFNMAAAMLIMVFDRIGMIGVLKAQGMRNSAIARIFLYRAAILFAKGAFWGNVVGLALVAVQALWHPVKLDPEGYMLSVLPVSIGWLWLLALNLATAITTIVVMVVPSMMVARIKCEESLKYKL